MENNPINETFDLKSLFRYFVRNWYWFVISFVLFACALFYYRAAKPQLIKVETIVHIRPMDEFVITQGSGLVPTTNKTVDIAEERAALMSRDVTLEAINELKLNVSYQKREGLQWVEQDRFNSDLEVTYPEGFLTDSMKTIVLHVLALDNSIEINCKQSSKECRTTVPSLSEPVVLKNGLTVKALQALNSGDRYQVTIAPSKEVLKRYDNKIKTEYPYRSKAMVVISMQTVRPYEAVEVFTKQVEIYNRIMVDMRQQAAREAIEAIDTHIAELNQQRPAAKNKEVIDQLIWALTQKREEKALLIDATSNPAVVVTQAHQFPKVVSPSVIVTIMLIIIFGIGLPLSILFLIFVISGKIYTQYQFSKCIRVPFIGQILFSGKNMPIVVAEGAQSAQAEQFNILRMQILRQLKSDTDKVIMVTSCVHGEGKSYVASNLALSFALLNKHVALVDMNLRHPAVNRIFACNTNHGITDYLNGDITALDKLTVPSGKHQCLDLILAGSVPTNPADLLQGEKLDQLFTQLRKNYDLIIVDTAQAINISDAFLANRVCDETIFIGFPGKTTEEMANFINRAADMHQMNNIVAVWNGVR